MTEHKVPPLRSDLGELPRYVAGAAPHAVGGASFKLSSNEVAHPVPSTVTTPAAAALAGAHRYPDLTGALLAGRLAETLDVDRSEVVVGAGSIAVFQQLLQAATDPGDRVVFAWRSYEAYPIVTRVCRTVPVAVPLTGQAHDLPAMFRAVTDRAARVVVVCNPNNPTGTTVGRQELEAFLDAVPPDCLVVIDEAYREFVTDPQVPDALSLARGRPNVVVLRTFSKAHGLAGLRIGYAVCPPPVAEAVRTVSLPFTVSSVAQAAAVAALDNWPVRQGVVADIVSRRDELAAALRRHGLDVAPSQANFLWLPWGPASARLAEALGDNGISVRRFGVEGLRVTTGEPEALTRLLQIAARTSAS